MKKINSSVLFLALGGLAAGFINGMLGAGGGIIIVYLLSFLLKRSDLSLDSRDVFANALCVMLPVSVLSCAIYFFKGSTKLSGFGSFIIPAVLGGIAGGFLLDRIKVGALKKLFALLVIVSGALLIVK